MTSEDPYAVTNHHSDTNLYLRGVPARIDDVELRSLFDPFGEVVSAMVMRDIRTGESMGTAFVRFAAHPSALAAMKYFYPNASTAPRGASKTASSHATPAVVDSAAAAEAAKAPIPGLVIHWARKQHDEALVGEARQSARKLFLRNIPQDVDGKMLFELVKPYGLVDQVTLHVDTAETGNPSGSSGPTGFVALSGKSSSGSAGPGLSPPAVAPAVTAESRMIAFVTFSEDGAAAAACDALHNTTPFRNHGGIPIMAKLAEDTRQRSARRSNGQDSSSGGGTSRGPNGHRPSLSATSTAHGNRSGQASGFSSYHLHSQARPAGFSTFQEMESTIYPSAMQAVAYSQHQPLSAARTDVYSKSAPISANQHYYGGGNNNYSADMVIPPRPPTMPLSSHTMQNYYSVPYMPTPGSPQGIASTTALAAGITRPASSLADLDTLSQLQGSHYEPSNADTASSNSRFRHNPYNAVDPQTII